MGGVNSYIVALSVISDSSDIACRWSEQNVGAFLTFVKIGPGKIMSFLLA